MNYIPIRNTKYGANVHKMLLSYCKIQANLIMLDVPYIMFQWCNNVLLNESPHINFTAIAELTATEESRVAVLLETLMDHLSTGFFFFCPSKIQRIWRIIANRCKMYILIAARIELEKNNLPVVNEIWSINASHTLYSVLYISHCMK